METLKLMGLPITFAWVGAYLFYLDGASLTSVVGMVGSSLILLLGSFSTPYCVKMICASSLSTGNTSAIICGLIISTIFVMAAVALFVLSMANR